MPVSLKMTTTGDLDTSGATLQLVAGAGQVIQAINRELRFVLGEWQPNRRLGFPYFQNVFVQAPTLAALRMLFARRILQIPGVTGLSELVIDTSELVRGEMIVRYQATTIEGGITAHDTIQLSSLGIGP